MKAFNMIFVCAYAFCIYLLMGVLGENEDSPAPDENAIQHFEQCLNLSNDHTFDACTRNLGSSLLFYSSEYYNDIEKKCIGLSPALLEFFWDPYQEQGFTVKTDFWPATDRCLPKDLVKKKKERGIDVNYNKTHLKKRLQHDFHLLENTAGITWDLPLYIQFMDISLNWMQSFNDLKREHESSSRINFDTPSDKKIQADFMRATHVASYHNADDKTFAAKFPFLDKKNVFALFLRSSKKPSYESFIEIIEHLKPVPENEKSFVAIPKVSKVSVDSHLQYKCAPNWFNAPAEAKEEIRSIFHFSINNNGIGAAVNPNPASPEEEEGWQNEFTFDEPFHFLLIEEDTNTLFFYAHIDTV